jgi:ribosomal protein S18 acetylase RimI-like enzyme
MSDVTVKALEGEDWQAFREVRLAALRESPEAFASTYEEELEFDEDLWRARLARSERLLACDGDEAVGIASLGQAEEEGVAELFGMWVTPSRRGSGVAWELTHAAALHARAAGRWALKLWVSTDNGRAVAFFSSYGFRPTDQRRPMTTDATVEELAMIVPLGDDPGWVPTTAL